MTALTGEALASKLADLTELASEKCRDSIIENCMAVAKGCEADIGDDRQRIGHVRHMMVMVIAELMASAVQGVLDDEVGGIGLAKATDAMVTGLVGPPLVALHRKATGRA